MKRRPIGTRPSLGVVTPFRIIGDGFVVNGDLQHNKIIRIDELLSNLLKKTTEELVSYCRSKNYRVGAAKLFDSIGLIDCEVSTTIMPPSEGTGWEWL